MKLGRSKHNSGRKSFHKYENANTSGIYSVLKFYFQSYSVLQKKCFYKHNFNSFFFQGSFNHKKICDMLSWKCHLSTKLKFN